jgi:hypothetical protein
MVRHVIEKAKNSYIYCGCKGYWVRVTEDAEKRKTLQGYKRKATKEGVVNCKAVATLRKVF